MASFDIINVVGLAYRKTWAERNYLLRMAAFPFLVKLACFTVLATYFESESLWMTGIVLLPAFFLEGWLLSHWARTIMTGGGHRWPFKFSGDEAKDHAELMSRGRGIMGGTVAFALINFLMMGYFAALFSNVPDLSIAFDPKNPDPLIGMIGAIFIVTSLLLFRFVWVFIPLAVNFPLEIIIQKLKPMNLTFRMIGLWLVCVVPAFVMIQLLGGLMLDVVGEGQGNAITQTGFMVVRIAIDMAKNLIVTAGMAYAFLVILKAKS